MTNISSMDMRAHLLTAINASVKAGDAILEIYDQDFSIEEKSDSSPLTLADKQSHEIILSSLKSTGIPVLSEEGKEIEFSNRKAWEMLWIVDPLDGTKEFIKKNGEFTINIALVCNHLPVLGVIYIPVLSLLYFAAARVGAFQLKTDDMAHMTIETLDDYLCIARQIHVDRSSVRPYTIVGSRSHATPELEVFVRTKQQEFENVNFISAGSSLKFCQIADGKADIYPRLGTTMEWDTAAGQVIAEQSGATVLSYENGLPLTYNKENLKNPWFIVSNGRH